MIPVGWPILKNSVNCYFMSEDDSHFDSNTSLSYSNPIRFSERKRHWYHHPLALTSSQPPLFNPHSLAPASKTMFVNISQQICKLIYQSLRKKKVGGGRVMIEISNALLYHVLFVVVGFLPWLNERTMAIMNRKSILQITSAGTKGETKTKSRTLGIRNRPTSQFLDYSSHTNS